MFGNQKTFAPVISEFQFLENSGVVINTSNGEKRVYLVLGLIIGDNLGLHSILGFVESFNATHPCRFCKATKRLTEVQCEEDIDLIRTRKSYTADVKMNNVSLTGIQENCIFNEISSFHVLDNYSVDVMHAILEGVCHYDLIHILNNLIFTFKLFTLDMLNYRLLMFDYGPIDKVNRPPSITATCLKKSKLKMTASEMFTFVKLLGLLIGDFVPTDNPFWQLYLLLRQIVEITHSKILDRQSSILMNTLVKDHHMLYLQICNDRLKPKHHHLLHFGRVFDMVGPVSHLSCMRFEAFHHNLKKSATVNMCRINLAHSVATKEQLNFCYRIIANNSILSTINVGPGAIVNLQSHLKYEAFRFSLPQIQNEPKYFSPNWIVYKGTRYQPKMCLLIGIDDILCPIFGEIETIIMNNNNEAIFICQMLHTIGYCEHVRGYEIQQSDFMHCIKTDDLIDPLPLYGHLTCTGERHIILEYII